MKPKYNLKKCMLATTKKMVAMATSRCRRNHQIGTVAHGPITHHTMKSTVQKAWQKNE